MTEAAQKAKQTVDKRNKLKKGLQIRLGGNMKKKETGSGGQHRGRPPKDGNTSSR